MLIHHVDPFCPDMQLIMRAADFLRKGELVAFPTETVYGLGANALDEKAVQRIFDVKGRPAYNPLIVHLASLSQVQSLVCWWPPAADRLAEAFWPGPLTLVLPKNDSVPDIVTAGLKNVALRVPSHPVAQALLREVSLPVAAPSANRSSHLSPTTAQHVEKSLGNTVELILDGGSTPLGIESTVVTLTSSGARLLRPGALSVDEIEATLGMKLEHAQTEDNGARLSPGMLERHYAPEAYLRLFSTHDKAKASAWSIEAGNRGERVGALLLTRLEGSIDHPLAMPDDPRAYARLLYGALHSLDDLQCGLILAENPPATSPWQAVRDRLQRAAHVEAQPG